MDGTARTRRSLEGKASEWCQYGTPSGHAGHCLSSCNVNHDSRRPAASAEITSAKTLDYYMGGGFSHLLSDSCLIGLAPLTRFPGLRPPTLAS